MDQPQEEIAAQTRRVDKGQRDRPSSLETPQVLATPPIVTPVEPLSVQEWVTAILSTVEEVVT